MCTAKWFPLGKVMGEKEKKYPYPSTFIDVGFFYLLGNFSSNTSQQEYFVTRYFAVRSMYVYKVSSASRFAWTFVNPNTQVLV